MAITRRQLIIGIAKAGAPAAVAVAVGTDVLQAGEPIPVPSAAVGLLYDASICIGCKACVAACAEANDTPPDTRGDALHQAPSDLNDLTRNVIKLYKPDDGSAFSFAKTVHALPGSGVRGGMSLPGVAQGSGDRRCQLDCRQVHWLPLLHHHLPVSHSAFPVGGVQSARNQVRVVQPSVGEGVEAGMHQRVPNRCSDFWPASRSADGCEAAD